MQQYKNKSVQKKLFNKKKGKKKTRKVLPTFAAHLDEKFLKKL